MLPTGTGKTIVFSKVVEQETKDESKALILAHRGELLDQALDELAEYIDLSVRKIQKRVVEFEDEYIIAKGNVFKRLKT